MRTKIFHQMTTPSNNSQALYGDCTELDMLRASEVCAHAAKDPLNRGEIASILQAASRILANTSLRPALANSRIDETEK
jgi:hypothetical protein